MLDMVVDLNDDYFFLLGYGVFWDGVKESVEMIEGGNWICIIIYDINCYVVVVFEGIFLDMELKDMIMVVYVLERVWLKDVINEVVDWGVDKCRMERIISMIEMEDF